MSETSAGCILRVFDRAARIAYAFVVMNYSAVAAIPALLFRKNVWRQ